MKQPPLPPPRNGLVVYGPDGEGRRATPEEQSRHDAILEAQREEALFALIERFNDQKLDKKMYKELRAKGLQQSKTRSTFAWRMRNKRASAEKFGSFSERTDRRGNTIPPSLDWNLKVPAEEDPNWDYCPPGEGTLFKLQPRLRYADLDVFDVWVTWRSPNGRKRRRCVKKGFKRNCGDASCKSEACAICWAVEYVETKDNETIAAKRREGPKPRVVDSSGVHPKGNRNAKAKDMGEDQRAIFQLTSSIHHHKKGASEW